MPAERSPLLLGHRGCRLHGVVENSLAAFSHAINSGCHGFEFDVRLTADAKLVCIHDENVDGMAVHSITYGHLLNKYLQTIDSVPCLPDVLQRFSSAFLDIELKVPGVERFTLELIRDHPPRSGYFISSFLPEVLCDIAELAPSVLGHPAELGYLFDTVSGLQAWPNMPGPWVVPKHNLVTRALVDSVHSAGRKLMTWTVNRPSEMIRLAEWGVDGLISDDPGLLRNTIHGIDRV